MEGSEDISLETLPIISQFECKELLGSGVFGKVYLSKDPATESKCAVKVQPLDGRYDKLILKEYSVLKDLCLHPNLPEFYGAYKTEDAPVKILFFMEVCEGGPVIDIVRALIHANRRMFEEHIAFILKEIIKALTYLHGHLLAHGDIKGNNILLTTRGEVKLIDFNLSRCSVRDRGSIEKLRQGSPCWMAPEIISGDQSFHGSRADVWSLAITAIEMGDGSAPYEDMHPTRALFHIEKNPPPGLYRPHLWSNTFNDFINECLVKNPEHRPLMMEVVAHPFITQLPERDYHLNLELSKLVEDFRSTRKLYKKTEIFLDNLEIKCSNDTSPQKLLIEDLSTMDNITEENILNLLHDRFDKGLIYTFIGDILLALNPDEDCEHLFTDEHHAKYKYKSKSDHAPHVFAVADGAYQNMLHYKEGQRILLFGETCSGKSVNAAKIIKHLSYMGETDRNMGDLINSSLEVLTFLTQAKTQFNDHSTRCVLQTILTYSSTGNISGVVYSIYQLEKWRAIQLNGNNTTFNIFHYFYEGMMALGKLHLYNLDTEVKPRIFKLLNENNKTENTKKFMTFVNNLLKLGLEDEQLNIIWNVLAAIIIINDMSFDNNDNELYTTEAIKKISENLHVDEFMFGQVLLNTYVVENETKMERKRTCEETKDIFNILAITLYSRLVDWITNAINNKFSFHRTLYGDSLSISILDMFGFESYTTNSYEQFAVNCINEQMQYLYNHLVFTTEMQEYEEEHVPAINLEYFDNKMTLDELFGKPDGIWETIHDTCRIGKNDNFVLDVIEKQRFRCIKKTSKTTFNVVHYIGTVEYNITNFIKKTNDVLSYDVVDILRKTSNEIIKEMFTNKLTETGNLVPSQKFNIHEQEEASEWDKALVHEKGKIKKNKYTSKGVYSQALNVPNASKIFRSTATKLLKHYSIDNGTGSSHLIRCIRRNLDKTKNFVETIVREQIVALFIKSTAVIRKEGYPCRISFQEFLKRYTFLAFGFDEKVELSKQNCRLLLLRLNMEGWIIGRTKVLLKYYNLEYLCRLYEYQMKKIVKTQCMVRSFLARKLMALRNRKKAIDNEEKEREDPTNENVEDEEILNDDNIADDASNKSDYESIAYYCKLWKNRTIYEVILKYRAARQQDLIYLCQQSHIFNQIVLCSLKESNDYISLDEIDSQTSMDSIIVDPPAPVRKLPFKLTDINFTEPIECCEPWSHKKTKADGSRYDLDSWDAPLQPTKSIITNEITLSLQKCDKNLPSFLQPYKALQSKTYSRTELPEENALVEKSQITESKSLNDLAKKSPIPSEEKRKMFKRKHSLADIVPVAESNLTAPTPEPKIVENKSPVKSNLGSNPIEELKLLKSKCEQSDNDDDTKGPFNFQAILRKTNLRHDAPPAYNEVELNTSPKTDV